MFFKSWLIRLVSAALIFQMALPISVIAPLARAADAPSDDLGSALEGIPDLFNQIAADSSTGGLPASVLAEDARPTPESLDYFRLLDQLLIQNHTKRPNKPVPASKVKLRQFSDGRVELYTGADPYVGDGLLTDQTVLLLDFPVLNPEVFAGQYLVWLDPGTQEIQFMDLKAYEKNLGQTAIPVFKIRLNAQVSLKGISTEFENGRFFVQAGDQRITQEVFQFYSELQQVAFRFTSNLVDPDAYADLGELTDDFEKYFTQATEVASDSLVQQVENLDANPIRGLTVAGDLKSRLAAIEKLQEDASLQTALKSVQKQAEIERKLGARIQLLWQRLTLPNRDAPAKVSQAVAMVRAGVLKGGLAELLKRPSVRYGVPLAAAALLGASYPEAMIHYLYQSLDLTRTIMDVFLTKGQDIGMIASQASQATLGWVNHPGLVYDAYLSKEKLPRTLVGLSAIVGSLYITLGLPHVITNTVSLVKDLKSADFSEDARAGQSRMEVFKSWFIARESKRKKDYIQMLSDAEAQRANTDQNFTEADHAEVKRLMAELGIDKSEVADEVAEQHRGWKDRFISKIKNWSLIKRFSSKSESQISTFRQALGHFLFGYASLTLSGFTYTRIWNAWFAFRSFIFKPSIWMTYLLYPKFMGTVLKGAAQNKGADLIVPSQWNGGNRTWLGEIANLWKSRSDTGREQLAILKVWEEKIISVEAQIREIAIKRTYQAMIPWMKDHEQLKAWMEARPDSAVLDAEQLEILTREQRLVFRLYSEELFNTAMTSFLKKLSAAERESTSVDLSLTPQQLKEISLRHAETLRIEEQDARLLVDEAAQGGKLFDQIKTRAKEQLFSSSVEAAQIALRDRVVSKIDPSGNRQISRLMAVQRQMKNPLAMARAIRSMIAANLIDKPMELMLTFLCFATVTQGFLMPIQDEMFGPNSWFYLSKFIFSTGYLSSVITGVLADTWMKLQLDELHNDQFGEVPAGDDAKKGYFSWWFKKTFRDPENSWWNNHKHNIGIIWANMPAAFVMMMVTNLVTLGRFDLDIYLISYFLTYALPLTGFGSKIEQGFELSSYYDLKNFPEKLRSHPQVLEYFNKKVTKRRMVFNIFFKIYENTLGYFITNFAHGSTEALGTRSLSRVFFGGYTPTEWIYLGLQKVDELFGWSPVVKGATHACASLLTTNYTGSKVIPEPTK